MSFLISSAFADTATAVQAAATPGGGLPQILMLAGFVLIFYLLVWRPQARRAKEQRQLLSNLAAGDEVTTSGGLAGKITKLDETILKVKIADKVEVNVQKSAIAGLLPKGTLKF